MSNVRRLISSLGELYKKLLKEESIEDNSVDFLLQEMEKQAEVNRKMMRDLGFWTEGGDYEEDYQEEGEFEEE